MKHIGTLVRDIQSVLTAHSPDKDAVSSFGNALAGQLVNRLCEGSPPPSLRMSNFATPDRKLWYTVNKPELAEGLSGASRLKFLYGDLLEELLIYLAEQAGHTVECKQMEVSYNGIIGHIDAVIDGVVVDVKSASSYGFRKFRNHELESNDPFGYLDQLSLYVLANRDNPAVKVKTEGAFLAIDKSTGELCLDVYKIKKDYDQELLRKTRMLGRDELPDRCYDPVAIGAGGNKKLPMECSWCPFKLECWKDANQGRGLRTFLYSTGSVYLTDVRRVPEVEEIT